MPTSQEVYEETEAVPPRRTPYSERDDRDDEPRRGRRRDWGDDDAEPAPRRRRYDYRSEGESSRAATVGFLCSIVSVGLIAIGVLLWMVLLAQHPRGRDADPFLFLFLAIGLASFVLGLIGLIFGSRGLHESNQTNRGMAVAGLVCGIIGMVIGLLGSIFFFCIGMVVMNAPWR